MIRLIGQGRIGATTRAGLISGPLRTRFGIVLRMDFYGHADLEIILKRSADILKVEMEDAGAGEGCQLPLNRAQSAAGQASNLPQVEALVRAQQEQRQYR